MLLNDVGVVAIGRNEGQRLVNCLKSIRPIASNIVYVDSGSADGSRSAARELGAVVVELDLTLPFTAARARNEGFASLKVHAPDISFVQFIDGDCVLVEGWAEAALAFLKERKDVAVVCGRRREARPADSIYNQLVDIEWNTPIGEALACGGDTLMRVEAFEAVGGFRPQSIAGEEPELCVRLRQRGWKIWRLDVEMTLHDAAMKRFSQWWLRAVRCGYAYAEVSRLHRQSPFGIWKKETVRAIFWGGVLPAFICFGALINPLVLAATAVYVFQVCRIALKRRPLSFQAWAYAFFLTLAKFAEFVGVCKYYLRRLGRQQTALIEYK